MKRSYGLGAPLLVLLVGGLSLACAGPMTPAPVAPSKADLVVQRVDFSHLDGISCMVVPRNGLLLDLKKPHDLDACGTRSRESYQAERSRGARSECVYSWSSQCCEQAGGTLVGWEGHTLRGELLASPLCRFNGE